MQTESTKSATSAKSDDQSFNRLLNLIDRWDDEAYYQWEDEPRVTQLKESVFGQVSGPKNGYGLSFEQCKAALASAYQKGHSYILGDIFEYVIHLYPREGCGYFLEMCHTGDTKWNRDFGAGQEFTADGRILCWTWRAELYVAELEFKYSGQKVDYNHISSLIPDDQLETALFRYGVNQGGEFEELSQLLHDRLMDLE